MGCRHTDVCSQVRYPIDHACMHNKCVFSLDNQLGLLENDSVFAIFSLVFVDVFFFIVQSEKISQARGKL